MFTIDICTAAGLMYLLCYFINARRSISLKWSCNF